MWLFNILQQLNTHFNCIFCEGLLLSIFIHYVDFVIEGQINMYVNKLISNLIFSFFNIYERLKLHNYLALLF